MTTKIRALKAAFPYTLPIWAGFFILGTSYGFLMCRCGFPFYFPILNSLFIFAGSMEIMTIDLLLAGFNPLAAFFLTLLINARHLFYGITLLEKYEKSGAKKFYMIFGLCDETFSLNSSIAVPADVEASWFYFFITLLNQFYWVSSATIGALLGNFVAVDLPGLDFVLTALFVVLFIDQALKSPQREPAFVGLVFAVGTLVLVGPRFFMVATMAIILLYFYSRYKKLEDKT